MVTDLLYLHGILGSTAWGIQVLGILPGTARGGAVVVASLSTAIHGVSDHLRPRGGADHAPFYCQLPPRRTICA